MTTGEDHELADADSFAATPEAAGQGDEDRWALVTEALAFLLYEREQALEKEGQTDVRDYARQMRSRLETIARVKRVES